MTQVLRQKYHLEVSRNQVMILLRDCDRGGFRGGGGGRGGRGPPFQFVGDFFFVKIYNNFIIL